MFGWVKVARSACPYWRVEVGSFAGLVWAKFSQICNVPCGIGAYKPKRKSHSVHVKPSFPLTYVLQWLVGKLGSNVKRSGSRVCLRTNSFSKISSWMTPTSSTSRCTRSSKKSSLATGVMSPNRPMRIAIYLEVEFLAMPLNIYSTYHPVPTPPIMSKWSHRHGHCLSPW